MFCLNLICRRGLSKHFEGKSQSFTSLTNVRSLEDLIKPERPFKKSRQLLKSSKSYGWGLDKSLSPKNSITKRTSSKGSFSSSLGNMRRHSSSNSSFRAPYPTPQRSGSLSRQALLETVGQRKIKKTNPLFSWCSRKFKCVNGDLFSLPFCCIDQLHISHEFSFIIRM